MANPAEFEPGSFHAERQERDMKAAGVKEVRGITLLEMLVTVGILAVLAALLLPAVGRVRERAARVACLNCLRQLQLGWHMYAQDHLGALVSNLALHTNGAWRSAPDSWTGLSSAPHDATGQNIAGGALCRLGYAANVQLFRCPADQSTVRDLRGQDLGLPRTRSYGMNGNVGGRTNEAQATVNRLYQIRNPSRLFVLIDEHAESIDDGHFLVWSAPDERWVNLPADRHSRGCNLSFADGHAEHWRWQAPKTFAPKTSYWKKASNLADLEDLRKLQANTLSHVPYSYDR
ncbi:prepilin-type N-terminal cleavage/methylation domain-containing protein [Fontisphaera persica]|uniref:type II secretion system protein n=1 Tax=Fontisphaera persica TaxID=2974023 RepID=UPI0024BF8F89|nr:prepilin-type N-terminal cleavage/methylation domain-containing protein [Fontisphaera persica]WCJ60620.1 prepilin-type N-terminal cleavage/methylation domain-containing protein [Fontisphaera persica]